MAAHPVPAVRLAKSTELMRLWQRVRDGESVASLLATPPPQTVALPVAWAWRDTGFVVELSTRGVRPNTMFLWLIVEPNPDVRMLIAYSHTQVNGYAVSMAPVNFGPSDWLRWSIHFTSRNVSTRVVLHAGQADPFYNEVPLQGIPTPHALKAVLIGATDVDELAVAEVRVWDGPMFNPIDDQLELLGRRRIDGRETPLIGYWPMSEGKGTRLADASRFVHDGAHNGGWLDAASSGLALDTIAEEVCQRQRAAIDLARNVEVTRDQLAGRRKEIDLANRAVEREKGELQDIDARLAEGPARQARDIAALETEFEQWKRRIEDGGKVGLDHFSETLAGEVEKASTALIAARSPYRLQSVGFDIKMLPVQRKGEKDFLVTFPLPDDRTVQPAQLSTLSLAYEPKPPEPARSEQVIPDVTGYTEGVARRLLQQTGFQVEIVDQATERAEDDDRVVDQMPRGGTKTGPQQSLQQPVMLFMGRLGGTGE